MKLCTLGLALLLVTSRDPSFTRRDELTLPANCHAALGKWQSGLLLAFHPYRSAPDEVCVVDGRGQVRLKGTVRIPGYEGVRIEDITATENGRIAIEGTSEKGRFIAWLGQGGQVERIVETGRHRTIITFAADGTLWSYHPTTILNDVNDSAEGFSLTHFDQHGAVQARFSFPSGGGAVISASAGGATLGDRMWALGDRLGIYRLGKAWMEVSYDGQLLGRWEDSARIARSIAVTKDGRVFATPRTDFDLLQVKIPLVWLDKDTGDWRPATGTTRSDTIVGTDGDDLVVTNSSGRMVWMRRE